MPVNKNSSWGTKEAMAIFVEENLRGKTVRERKSGRHQKDPGIEGDRIVGEPEHETESIHGR